VILTHLHYDHAGGCQRVPRAHFLIQRRELMEAAAPMGPRKLEIGGRELFYDRKDVAALVDELWDRVELLEGDAEPFPGIPACCMQTVTRRAANASTWTRKKVRAHWWGTLSGRWT